MYKVKKIVSTFSRRTLSYAHNTLPEFKTKFRKYSHLQEKLRIFRTCLAHTNENFQLILLFFFRTIQMKFEFFPSLLLLLKFRNFIYSKVSRIQMNANAVNNLSNTIFCCFASRVSAARDITFEY